ncbi:oxidoreductase [Thalassotalea insulae]|uniref:Oxidoreductase n=1 Tax=Thalassotalea insulae TaxID=2056778 RepID=A0ABQ6GMC2_9GAMM|nr:(2Fe-2S)-binding protein [Thalassotalea insulae]GLX77067.1 oxidoreductase [Thalassotalea insulae]
MIHFTLNGKNLQTNIDSNMPLLWLLRDEFKLTGTKFGCGKGLCGACTVLVNKKAIRSCITPIKQIENLQVTTIEAIDTLVIDDKPVGRKVQQSWQALNVPQCGYCQSGQIMSATALLITNSAPNSEEIKHSMSGNICRCGTYQRIRKAIQHSASKLTE